MKRILPVIIVLILTGLIVIELGSMGFEQFLARPAESQPNRPGWQSTLFSTLFDWHEPDTDLLWRFRAGVFNSLIQTNEYRLLRKAPETPKGRDAFRISLLGDSSPVGLGLLFRHEAFGEIAAAGCDQIIGSGRRVELVNAAVPGYSSEQIRRYFERYSRSLDPDLVVLYCGNNDASLSGPYTDRELLAQTAAETLSLSIMPEWPPGIGVNTDWLIACYRRRVHCIAAIIPNYHHRLYAPAGPVFVQHEYQLPDPWGITCAQRYDRSRLDIS